MSDAIVIVGAARTPIGGLHGALSGAAKKAALHGARVEASTVDELLMGCVCPQGKDRHPCSSQ